jgi:hypothetical protein
VQIQVNTDNQIEGDQSLKATVKDIVEQHLGRFGERITRVEVHLTDVNANKGGRDIRCVMEARIAGLQPIVVDELEREWERSTRNAAEKLVRAIDSRLGRLGRT